jgi:long-chain fatty acid transport protein
LLHTREEIVGKSRAVRTYVIPAFFLALLACSTALHAQGIALSGVGPVNRSMGGAATAAPIDAAGALMWNPASISGLKCNEVDIGLELLLPSEKLSSSIPAFGLQGSTGGEPGVMPIPELAWVHKCEDSRMSIGVGVFGIAGFATNFPASLTNPVLTPQPPNGLGLGRISSEAEYYQVIPTASYAVSDRLSIGFAPTLTIAKLDLSPMVFAPADDANGDGFATYPTSDGTRYHFGGGFQVGIYYTPTENWSLGFCFKSPQWFETFTSNVTNELGQPETSSVRFDYPMIFSLGTAYSGFERWLFACDVRYFNYAGTAGFEGPAAFGTNGALLGLGWKNIFSVHAGAQYCFSDRFSLRAGYQFNPSPIDSDTAFFNVGSPLITEHIVSCGFSYRLTDHETISVAYLHAFQNEVSGPITSPIFGTIPGTSATSTISADSLGAGLTVTY